MVKLFLVEDEIAMRDGIRRHIHWEEEGILFCGEAGDGELAWPKILECRPDIVITDIKMPFMDGLQLSRLIRQELPETRIIILSGYTEFQYAQEALRIGVSEYLVKPITPKGLKEVIRRVAGEIEETRKSRQERLDLIQEEEKEKEKHQKRKFFRSLVSEEFSSHQLLTLSEETGLRLEAPCYQILLLFIHYSPDAKSQEQTENALETLTEDLPGCFLFEHSVDSLAVLLSAKSEDSLKEKRNTMTDRLVSSIKAESGQEYYISVGKTVTHLSEIRASYKEANRVSSYRFFLPPDQIILGDIPFRELLAGTRAKNVSGQINTETALKTENLRSAWENFLRTGTLPEAGGFIEDIFSSVGEDNVKSVLFLSYLTMDGYFTMARFLKELGRDPKEADSLCGDINSMIASLESEKDARNYLTGYLQEVIRTRDNKASGKNQQLLHEAVAYIDSSFTDEDMSLVKASAAAGMSPNRFSSLFSHEMGMTFIEYLIGKRMELAKELLMSTDLRSSEIAYRAGYKDPHYFSATFKKIQGMSPREYRMRGKEEHEDSNT